MRITLIINACKNERKLAVLNKGRKEMRKHKGLLLGSIQLRAVYLFPNDKDVYLLPYLLPCFCFS